MPVNVTSKLFFDQYTETGGGGTPYLPGHVTDKIRLKAEISVSWSLTDVRLQFTAADDSIQMLNLLDSRRFNSQGFQAGDTIEVSGTDSNDGALTIESISDDGITIYVAEALVDETATGVSVYGTTPITALDWLYNIIPNASAESYVSLSDTDTIQKFRATGLDASDTVTTVYFRLAAKSWAWFTGDISDTSTGETQDVRIRGLGISADYVQSFEILHDFRVAPVWLADQFSNFENQQAPEYFTKESSLKYIARLNAFFEAGNSEADHTGGFTSPSGAGSWFGSGFRGGFPEYYVSAIQYKNNDTDAVIDRIDISIPTRVIITLSSRSNLFTAESLVDVGFFLCPSDSAQYQNKTETKFQALFWDRALQEEGEAAIAGELFRTAYQSITDCEVTLTGNDLNVEFVFDPGADLLAFMHGLSDGDRYYTIYVATQDPAVKTTKASDRVVCLADFQSADYTNTNPDLFAFSGAGIYAYEYPDPDTIGVGSIEGFAGDPWVVKIPFLVDNQQDADGNIPMVQSIACSVVAKKTGYNDFYLERYLVDCSGFKNLQGVQQLSIDQRRGFTTYEDDPFNTITIERDAGSDTATQAGYIMSYPIVLRYESWIDADNQPGVENDGSTPDVAKSVESLTHRWADYQTDGWALAFRFDIDILGTDGVTTSFQSDIDLSVIDDGSSDWAGGSGALTQNIQFFEYDDSGAGINNGYAGEELKSFVQKGQTLIRVTYAGDWALPAEADGWYGWMMSSKATGSIFDRHFASSEIPSEDDSPFSDPGTYVEAMMPDYDYANGNVRIKVYIGVKIVLESLFDSTAYADETELFFMPRLGAKYIST